MKNGIMALLLSVSLIALAGAPQAAAKNPAETREIPGKVDLDGDGRVSLAEHLAWEKGVFITNDLNGDGNITPAEISQRQVERVTKLRDSGALQMSDEDFSKVTMAQYVLSPNLDVDGDKRISLFEHLDFETRNFREHDLDNDGFITMEEIALKQIRMAGERIRQKKIEKGIQQKGNSTDSRVMQEPLEKQFPRKDYQK